MKEKIIELRKIVPIPMGEAMQMLKDNDNDVEKCIYLFKAKSIKEILALTGCDEEIANKYYEAEKYDFNRTVSSIREDLFDKNYVHIEGVTKENISLIYQWLRIIEDKDFGFSLDFSYLNIVLDTLLLLPPLKETAEAVRKAKKAKDTIFEGYSDTDSLDEFVRRHKKLGDNEEFQKADRIVSLKLTIIREELMRHARNL